MDRLGFGIWGQDLGSKGFQDSGFELIGFRDEGL